MSASMRRWSAIEPQVFGGRPLQAPFALRKPLDETDLPTLGLLSGLQCLGRAAVALDGGQAIVGMNELVRPLTGHLFRMDEGRLAGRSSSIDERTRRLVGLALGLREKPRAGVDVLRPPGAPALIVRALPVPAGEGRLFRETRALVLFARAGGAFLPDAMSLREAFGLTATEAEVALALAGGANPRAIADERSISLATVRTHLKTILAKTRTKRQAALVALILQLADVAPPG